jgi:hypothetical protein
MGKRTHWFDYKKEQISGWQYLFRMIIAGVLTQLVLPGLLLASSTVYKRSNTLKWSYNLCALSAVLISTNILIGVFIDYFNNQIFEGVSMTGRYVFVLISLTISGIHFTLLFSNKPQINQKFVAEETVSHNDSNTTIEKYNNITENDRYDRLKKMIIKSHSSGNRKYSGTSSKVSNQTIQNQAFEAKTLGGFSDLISSDAEIKHDQENKPTIDNEFSMRVVRSNDRYESKLDNNWSI